MPSRIPSSYSAPSISTSACSITAFIEVIESSMDKLRSYRTAPINAFRTADSHPTATVANAMKTPTLLTIGVIAVITFFGLKTLNEHKLIQAKQDRLRAEHARIAGLEAKLPAQSVDAEKLELQIKKLERETRDLYRLRSQVHQLRQRTNELPSLRTANLQLKQALADPAVVPDLLPAKKGNTLK